jgi:hypothetical protein
MVWNLDQQQAVWLEPATKTCEIGYRIGNVLKYVHEADQIELTRNVA